MKKSGPSPGVVRFGVFEADLRSGELRKQGMRIKLQEQPFQILALLLARAGDVVTREELREKLWPADTFVDFDHSLGTAIKKLREALGDSAENPRFVETLPRRGYRFIGQVDELGAAVRATPAPQIPTDSVSRRVITQLVETILEAHRSRRWWRIWTVVAVALAVALAVGGYFAWQRLHTHAGITSRKVMMVVLPFENLSGGAEQDYFSDGLTEEVITQLGGLEPARLGVIARNSAVQYKQTNKIASQIGSELGVDYILEGTVRREADRARITVQLIQVKDQTYMWTQSYERELRDILALQSDVARDVARQIRIELTPQSRARLAAVRPVNPEAYEAYLRGQFQWGKLNEEGLRKSIEYFQKAIEIDSGYALAYAGQAASYAVLGQQEILPPREAYAKSKELALKALELDGALAEAHTVLGWVHRNYDWDLPGAEKEFKRALELNPGSAAAHHGYAAYFGAMRQFDEALAEERRAEQLDPLSSFYNGQLALELLVAGRYQEGMDQCHRTLELDPTNSRAHFGIGIYYERKGEYDQAITELQRSVELSGSRFDVLAELGHAYVLAGKRVRAENILAQMKELSKVRNVSPLGFAVLYTSLGNKDQAFAWLEKAYEERSPFLLNIRVDPGFDNLRSDPRFTDLVRRMGLPP